MIKVSATRGDGTIYTRAYVTVGVIALEDVAEAQSAAIEAMTNQEGGFEAASVEQTMQVLDLISLPTAPVDNSVVVSEEDKAAAR